LLVNSASDEDRETDSRLGGGLGDLLIRICFLAPLDMYATRVYSPARLEIEKCRQEKRLVEPFGDQITARPRSPMLFLVFNKIDIYFHFVELYKRQVGFKFIK
jgi:hypothetical protein